MQPKVYISFMPSRPGSVFALFYLESGKDIYGWHIETREHYFSAAFFMIENFYARSQPHLYRSIEDDVYSPWVTDYPPAKNNIRCPVPERDTHDLERIQSRFVEDWLFFSDDIHMESEVTFYQAHGLPVHEVNIKSKRLQRLRKQGAHWVHASPGTDSNVVQLLRKYWRLSEKISTL
jgi:hypothetical protein